MWEAGTGKDEGKSSTTSKSVPAISAWERHAVTRHQPKHWLWLSTFMPHFTGFSGIIEYFRTTRHSNAITCGFFRLLLTHLPLSCLRECRGHFLSRVQRDYTHTFNSWISALSSLWRFFFFFLNAMLIINLVSLMGLRDYRNPVSPLWCLQGYSRFPAMYMAKWVCN